MDGGMGVEDSPAQLDAEQKVILDRISAGFLRSMLSGELRI
jgi:hypothetical protein